MLEILIYQKYLKILKNNNFCFKKIIGILLSQFLSNVFNYGNSQVTSYFPCFALFNISSLADKNKYWVVI